MSKRTTIYVLFKEYPDYYGRGKSSPYIEDSTDYLTHKEALLQDWTEVADILDFFNYEVVNKYYDEDNLFGLLNVADTFPEEYPSISNIIRAEIKDQGLTSWKTNSAQRTEEYCFGQLDVTNNMLGDMAQREIGHIAVLQRVRQDAERKLSFEEKEYEPCVLLQKGAVMAPHGEIQITLKGGRCLKMQSVSNIRDMHSWFSQHRFPYRHYVYNPKHGDAKNKAQMYIDRHGDTKCAAQLKTMTGTTRSLLKKAIGNSNDGDLWYYDQANDCYIYFENQGKTPQHEYHAYHLCPGDKNYDKIDVVKLKKVFP